MQRTTWAIAAVVFAVAACGDDKKDDASDGLFGESAEPGGVNPPVTSACISLTRALEGSYTPGADDEWPECISDDGKYHPINPSISAVARTQVFEEIGALLFDPDKDASKADFLEARKLYEEDEGLGSRVVRRYDPHYKPIGDADCSKQADVEANPDYCAGPAKISPLVQAALKKGYEGKDARWHAGRIEGALLWFLAISEYKETLSCSDGNIQDCDSAYGYYDGAGMGIGLGRYIRELDPEADRDAALGALAVRCWRDVDDALPATNKTLQERARTQFDRPVIRGTIAILLDRIDAAEQESGEAQRYHWGFVTAFLGALQSQAFRASGTKAILADARVAAAPDAIDLNELRSALDSILDCAD